MTTDECLKAMAVTRDEIITATLFGDPALSFEKEALVAALLFQARENQTLRRDLDLLRAVHGIVRV